VARRAGEADDEDDDLLLVGSGLVSSGLDADGGSAVDVEGGP
jgi:hypothetical protein